MRRPQDSIVSLPLPLVKVRTLGNASNAHYSVPEVVQLPCDVALLMCDPEWRIKTAVEICIFIYRPDEDFSDLLGRWRRTQVTLSQTYEWIMPRHYNHIFSEGEGALYPLFVGVEGMPARILRGLNGASLPYVMKAPDPSLTGDFMGQDEAQSLGAIKLLPGE
ncbi:hypothetical protein [Prochlorothrix hollandica]|nr:hypothetical protein [Prochlorothrix hollandica]